MADPTPEEVRAALAILAAAETARESHVIPPPPAAPAAEAPTPEALTRETEQAAETKHVMEQATASHVPVDSGPVSPAAPIVDPYLARSVKSSPNGF